MSGLACTRWRGFYTKGLASHAKAGGSRSTGRRHLAMGEGTESRDLRAWLTTVPALITA